MSDNKFRSRLFKASVEKTLLDERVSKIVLPTFDAMDASEFVDSGSWVEEESSEEEEEVETLQIFVGTSTGSTEPEISWDMPSKYSDEYSDFDEDDDIDFDDAEDGTLSISVGVPSIDTKKSATPMVLQIGMTSMGPANPIIEPEQDLGVFFQGANLQSIVEVDEDDTLSTVPSASEISDEWNQISWDDVTLSDILGTEDTLDDDSDDYGDKLDFMNLDELPLPTLFSKKQQENVSPVLSVEKTRETVSAEETNHSESDSLAVSDEDATEVILQKTSKSSILDNTEEQQGAKNVPIKLPPPPEKPIMPYQEDIWSNPLVVLWVVFIGVVFIWVVIWKTLS